MAQMSQAGDLTSGPMLKKIILFSQRQIVKDFLIKFTENSQKVPEALYGS